jgi:hypothetical protein
MTIKTPGFLNFNFNFNSYCHKFYSELNVQNWIVT